MLFKVRRFDWRIQQENYWTTPVFLFSFHTPSSNGEKEGKNKVKSIKAEKPIAILQLEDIWDKMELKRR